ncbi:MAG: leucine-rich repeat protein, partial [Culicoidibacterales bacterium]
NVSEIRRSIYVYTGEKPVVDGTHRYYISNDTLYMYDGPGGTVTVPEGVKTIGKAVFQSKRIHTINFPETLEVIEAEAFWGNNINTLTFPKNLKVIGERAFYNNTSYNSKQIIHFTGDKAPSFGNEWFWSYYRADRIEIQHPKTLAWAFVSDAELQANSNMNFERIAGYFAELSGTEDIAVLKGTKFDPRANVVAIDKQNGDITNKIRVIGEVDSTKVGTYTLNYEITSSDGHKTADERIVTVHEQTQVIEDGIHQDGEHVFFTRNSGQLYKYLGPGGTITIPQGVIAIEKNVFLNNWQAPMKAVNLPTGLTYIGEAAFQGANLEDIVFPESLLEIDSFAFAGNNLKNVKLPSQLEVIGEKAFYSNWNLHKVIFTGAFPELGNEWLWSYQSRVIQIEHPM